MTVTDKKNGFVMKEKIWPDLQQSSTFNPK